MTYLPPLDGTTEAAVTRLDAWLAAERDYSLVEALSAIQDHLREATTVTNALGRASVDCTDEDCTCGHDLPFLADELDAARKVLGDVLAEAERGGIVALGLGRAHPAGVGVTGEADVTWQRRYMRRPGSLVERNDFRPMPWHIGSPRDGATGTYCGVNVTRFYSTTALAPFAAPPEGEVCGRCVRQYRLGEVLPQGSRGRGRRVL